jgi:DNA-binding MarR family transcriptional regulator
MTDHTDTEALVERCNEIMRRLGGVARAADSDWLALDVGMGQFKAMVVLKEQGRQCVGGLARALNISEPSASLLVDKLVIRGLASRDTDPGDRRRTLVALTEEGDQLMTRLHRSREDKFVGWLSQVAEDDLQVLLQGLEALIGIIDRQEGSTEGQV